MGRFVLAFAAALVVLVICNAFNRTAPIMEPVDNLASRYDGRSVERVEFVAFDELAPLTRELNYTPETWLAGQIDVPRLVLLRVPERFGEVTVNEITVERKKRMFFRMVLPLVLIANEEVASERAEFLSLRDRIRESRIPHADDLKELHRFAQRYGVPVGGDVISVTKILNALERRIDIVPPSLALAQAATESAWGTSRFAIEGNALFGQWTFGRKGMVPEEQRAEKGDHKVAAFRTPLNSVRSYLKNLNTHRAYSEFRETRAALRRQGANPSGKTLAVALSRYSERGAEYVKEILEIIGANGLSILDRSKLLEGTVYELLPVWRGES
ncbi:glucosaminidase domain-containing protein [Nisaea acidiphila]|uniref:Glucosaminidase domain-containing protein n=1 Tax=Nisaea acidiphila TaxID=1862145 RepID=A0A9J7ATK2_9PROT|nr:glucosaminidase domain-containing protein [Nisaea acidiphila]UUX50672.1 glucosaminidase domain-containing protein [Nisaea acidiphila]